jgi:hypothetical protein
MHQAESYLCLATINYVALAQQVLRLCDSTMAVAHIDLRMLNYPDPQILFLLRLSWPRFCAL